MDDLNNETHNNVGPGTYHYHQEFVKASFNQNKHSVMPKSEKKGNFTEKTGGTKLGPGSYDYDFTRIKTKRFYNIKI